MDLPLFFDHPGNLVVTIIIALASSYFTYLISKHNWIRDLYVVRSDRLRPAYMDLLEAATVFEESALIWGIIEPPDELKEEWQKWISQQRQEAWKNYVKSKAPLRLEDSDSKELFKCVEEIFGASNAYMICTNQNRIHAKTHTHSTQERFSLEQMELLETQMKSNISTLEKLLQPRVALPHTKPNTTPNKRGKTPL